MMIRGEDAMTFLLLFVVAVWQTMAIADMKHVAPLRIVAVTTRPLVQNARLAAGDIVLRIRRVPPGAQPIADSSLALNKYLRSDARNRPNIDAGTVVDHARLSDRPEPNGSRVVALKLTGAWAATDFEPGRCVAVYVPGTPMAVVRGTSIGSASGTVGPATIYMQIDVAQNMQPLVTELAKQAPVYVIVADDCASQSPGQTASMVATRSDR